MWRSPQTPRSWKPHYSPIGPREWWDYRPEEHINEDNWDLAK